PWRHRKVLPQARKIGKSQVDHLDLVVLDCLEDVLGAFAVVRHSCLRCCECGWSNQDVRPGPGTFRAEEGAMLLARTSARSVLSLSQLAQSRRVGGKQEGHCRPAQIPQRYGKMKPYRDHLRRPG